MTRGAGLLVAISAVVLGALPLFIVVVFVGSMTNEATGGLGGGLRAGTVPDQYVGLVLAAGSLCAAAPPSIIAAQIEAESSWNPQAHSPDGAQGIAQFMPDTWPEWSNPGESPFDPTAAIPAQGRYDCALAQQVADAQRAGRLPAELPVTDLMLAAYHAGLDAVLGARGVPQNGVTPPYVRTITARAAYYADSTGAGMAGPFAQRVIAAARSKLGVPYSWAGGNFTGPTLGHCEPGPAANACRIIGFDCSGLVMFALYQASGGRIRVSHSAHDQTLGDAAANHAIPVARGSERPGDIISFTNPGDRIAHHVGIYLGGGQMINAPHSGAEVRIESLDSAYYRGQQWRVVRYQ